jgi:hypothetical protein
MPKHPLAGWLACKVEGLLWEVRTSVKMHSTFGGRV